MSDCVTHHHACACRESHFARLEKELQEQARLNGMGSEREAALLGKVGRLEKELEAARAEKEHALRQHFVDCVDVSTLKSQLEQARQSNEVMRSVLRFILIDAVKCEESENPTQYCITASSIERGRTVLTSLPPLPASRVKALERACRYILVDAVPCEESESPKQYCITAHAVEYVREALDAEASHAAACPLDAADFTPVRDNCGSGNLGKQEQNEPHPPESEAAKEGK